MRAGSPQVTSLYSGGLEPVPKFLLDLGQQILSDSRLDPLLPLQKKDLQK